MAEPGASTKTQLTFKVKDLLVLLPWGWGRRGADALFFAVGSVLVEWEVFCLSPGWMSQAGQDGDADSAPAAPLAGEMQSDGWGIALTMPMGVWGRLGLCWVMWGCAEPGLSSRQ